METLFNKGYYKILQLFYSQKSAKIHLREIGRRTKLNENSVSIFLKKLEKHKIISSMKEGNLKKYGLMQNDKVYNVLAYFDVLRFTTLPHIRQSAILQFLDALDEKPVIALLFGSTAKQTATQESDIDVLLIVNKKIQTKEAIKRVDAQTAQKISDFQVTMKEFMQELKLKQDHVVQSAIQTGFPLTNHLTYYRGMYYENV